MVKSRSKKESLRSRARDLSTGDARSQSKGTRGGSKREAEWTQAANGRKSGARRCGGGSKARKGLAGPGRRSVPVRGGCQRERVSLSLDFLQAACLGGVCDVGVVDLACRPCEGTY